MTRLGDSFASARREGRAAFIAYLTAGDPSFRETAALARALAEAGADVLELGVPFSDPIADGPVLQRSAARALARGATVERVLDCAAEIRETSGLALVLFSYANPLVAAGFPRTMRRSRAAGFDGVLLTDVPPEECGSFRPATIAEGLDPVFLVSPTSPFARMRMAARFSRGFLYAVSRTGPTGARASLSGDLPATVRRARRAAGSLPVAVGFGISTPADVRRAAAIADGVIVGSAIVAAAESGGARRRFAVSKLVRSLVRECRR